MNVTFSEARAACWSGWETAVSPQNVPRDLPWPCTETETRDFPESLWHERAAVILILALDSGSRCRAPKSLGISWMTGVLPALMR